MKDSTDGTPQHSKKDRLERRKAIVGFAVTAILFAVLLVTRPGWRDSIYLIIGFILIIMLHEFGHFVVAKRAGMKVTEFFLGFGPRLWSFHKGETEYGIKLIPLGGYVRIIGMHNMEQVDPADEPRTYRAAPFHKRLPVVLAGVTVNLILAFVLMYAVIWRQGIPDSPTRSVALVSQGGAAAKAGFQKGDQIRSINGKNMKTFEDVTGTVRANKGKQLSVGILRNGKPKNLTVTPIARCSVPSQGQIGIGPGTAFQRFGPVDAFGETTYTMYRMTADPGALLGKFLSFSGLRTYGHEVVSANSPACGSPATDAHPLTPVGFVAFGSQLVDGNVWLLLALLAAVNLFVGLLNLLPILPFDGGHVAIAIYEKIASMITKRNVRADYRKLIPVLVVVLILFGLSAISELSLELRQLF